jgi:hypothetical protein
MISAFSEKRKAVKQRFYYLQRKLGLRTAHTLIEEQRKPRSRIFFVLLWVLMLIIAFSLIIVMFNLLSGLFPQRLVSLDWGGYVAFSDYTNPRPIITGVSSSWTVPRVTVTSDNSFSAIWIGIGGYGDTTLIQAGTEHDFINGLEVYSAWYELLPGESVNITTVHPGDKINASIMLIDSTTNAWSINIHDTTTGQKFNKSFTYNSSRLSAEWIVERPTTNNGLSPLANFGSVTFTNSMAINNVTAEAINRFSFARITMYNRQNKQLVSVSSLSSDGKSFTVSYLSADSIMSSLNNHFENTIAVAISLNSEELLRSVQHIEQAFVFLTSPVIRKLFV